MLVVYVQHNGQVVEKSDVDFVRPSSRKVEEWCGTLTVNCGGERDLDRTWQKTHTRSAAVFVSAPLILRAVARQYQLIGVT